jgi:hypothetical protein
MLNLTKQSQIQVLVVGDTSAQYSLWQDQTLTPICVLGLSEMDVAIFSDKLREYSRLPIIFITDFTEENFRNESVVHVSASDRNAMLERKVGYLFRKTPYRTAKVIGREPGNRKHDQVLMSALTRPEQLQPWIDAALKFEISIQSVTSVAYLIEAYSHSVHQNKDPHLLIVSLENDNRLRQTFLSKGKLLFSRSTFLTSTDAKMLEQDISQETLHIRRYLERIRLLQFDDDLKMHLYSTFAPGELEVSTHEGEKIDIEYYTIDSVLDFEKVRADTDQSTTGQFLSHVLTGKKIDNIYAPAETRKFYLLESSANLLKLFSVALISITLIYKAPVAYTIYDKWAQEDRTVDMTIPYENQYNLLRQSFPETPIPSNEMELVVETLESIIKQSPDTEFLMSAIMASLTRAPNLKITEISWGMEIVEPQLVGTSRPRNRNADPATEFHRAVLNGHTSLKAVVTGTAFSPGSYRVAQNQVLDFAYALDAVPGISVTPLRLPTDIRLDNSVTTTIDDRELKAPFALEIMIDEDEIPL